MADKGVYKQDMVVSTRYRNDLPPPPMPPKLLNIDTGGLEQYLTPAFASQMARREEPNIEADAEGGMPIDMIGIPGYFLGDESAIMAPEHQPLLDPADMALMATPDQLRNSSGKSGNVSFLRRTQYISGARTGEILRTTAMRPKQFQAKQPDREALSKEDPVYIKRFIQKGFDIAYPDTKQSTPQADRLPAPHTELDAWRNPVHPDNRNLKPVEFYPLLPDLDAYPTAGGFTSLKFDKAPLPATDRGKRDERIDVALLQAAHDPAEIKAWQAKADAYESNPELYEPPGEAPMNLALHLPEEQSAVSGIKTVLNDSHPLKDANPTVDGNPEQFSYRRQRIYRVANPISIQDDSYRSIALSLYDPTSHPSPSNSRLAASTTQKAAYYYPISQIMKLKAKPPTSSQTSSQVETGVSDAVTLMVHEADEDRTRDRAFHRAQVDAVYKQEYDEKYPREPTPTPEPEPAPAAANGHAGGEDKRTMRGSEEVELRNAVKGVVGERSEDEEMDEDAEGEADESD